MKPKLVRDKIPEIIISNGEKPITHIANGEEYYNSLKDKLIEEVNEFLEDDSIEELADVLEVINSISKYKTLFEGELEGIRQKKAEERGSFDKKIILDKIE